VHGLLVESLASQLFNQQKNIIKIHLAKSVAG